MQGRKIICLIMAVLLIIPTLAQAGMLKVCAEEKETFGEKTFQIYEGGNYKITYAITGSWESHESIEIILENTGTENINDWSVVMDTTGVIMDLWNATQQSGNEGQTIIKCQNYNSIILPGNSITFGYTLEGENLKIPENIKIAGMAKEIETGYRLEYHTTGDWGSGFQAEITIINESTQPLEGWSLSLTGNFTMENYWNGEVTQNEDGSYNITHTAWDNSIPAGDSRTIGFVGIKTDDEMRIDSTKLTAIIWGGASPGEEIKPSEPETKPTQPTDPTEPENDPTISEEEINWNDETDTDGDGIPDVYEKHMFWTNAESVDTDGDGLPDGYEIINLGTDATRQDSDENGIPDAREDADKDGLDNLKEYELGTNPLSEDSDYDGLTDNDELQVYGTDPKNNDTDGDGIHDGDEIKLGLSPLNPSTNGIPDSQYTVEQSISEISPALEEINTSTNNPYQLSLDIKAAGLAENNITIQGTTENELFRNESYIGELISIDYRDDLKVETLRLNFHMNENVLENELDLFGKDTTELRGIRRFNVFKFVEETNMLLPIKTYHDMEQNIVYAETNEDGIYYLVDMEKWLYGLWALNYDQQTATYMMDLETECIQEEIHVQNESTMELPEDFYFLTELSEMEEMPMLMSEAGVTEEKDNRPIDIVFVTQSEGLWNEGYVMAENFLIYLHFKVLLENYNNIRVCVLNRTKNEKYFLGANGSTPQWFTTTKELIRNKPQKYVAEEVYIVRDYFDILCNQEIMGYREDAAKFVLDDQLGYNQVGYYYFRNSMKKMKNMGINFSEFQAINQCYGGYTTAFRNAIESTGGNILTYESSESSGIYDFPNHVDNVMSTWTPPQKEFPAVVATGYRTIFLQNTLNSTNGTDSDGDGLTD